MRDLALGEMLPATGVPPGLPTPQRAGGAGITTAHAKCTRPRALHSQCYFQGYGNSSLPSWGCERSSDVAHICWSSPAPLRPPAPSALWQLRFPALLSGEGATRSPAGCSGVKQWQADNQKLKKIDCNNINLKPLNAERKYSRALLSVGTIRLQIQCLIRARAVARRESAVIRLGPQSEGCVIL